jgi:hypothetical protein
MHNKHTISIAIDIIFEYCQCCPDTEYHFYGQHALSFLGDNQKLQIKDDSSIVNIQYSIITLHIHIKDTPRTFYHGHITNQDESADYNIDPGGYCDLLS